MNAYNDKKRYRARRARRAGLNALVFGGLLASGTAMAQNQVGTQPATPAAADAAAAPQTTSAPADADQAVADASGADIVVTGQRRSQRLQDVPVAIDVVSNESISNSGFRSPSDLQYLAPSLTFNPQLGAGFQIRGVGSQGFDYNLEKSVATVLDDVVQALPRDIGFNTLADVDHVEVLSGPQGTLYGKNASAGVLYVVTKRPQLGERTLDSHYRFGTDNELLAENTINLPITDTLATRITGVVQRRDGFLTNVTTGAKVGGYEDQQLRAKLLWKPASDLSIYLIGDLQRHHDTGTGQLETFRQFGTTAGAVNQVSLISAVGITAGPTNELLANDGTTFARIASENVSGNITYRLGDFELTSITAYKQLRFASSNDPDNTPSNFFSYNQTFFDANQFTQEVRLNSPVGSTIDFVFGGFFFDQKVTADEHQGGVQNNQTLPANTLISTTGGVANYVTSSRSLAAFGQANIHFTDKLTGILGGRFTHDRVAGRYFTTQNDPYYTLIGTVPAAAGASTTNNDVSGRATLQYEPSDTAMIYATVSRGYKAPAIGTNRGTATVVQPETVMNYEVGIKSQWFDHAVTLNINAFLEKFTNFQTQTQVIGTDGVVRNILANAQGLKSPGVEVEARWRVLSKLSLSSSMAYTPTKYTSFLTTCYALQPLLSAPGNGCYLQPGTTTRVYQASGQSAIYAPKVTLTAGIDYEKNISGDQAIFFNATYSHRSSAYSVAGDPNTIIPGYGLFNGTLGVGPQDGRWRIGLYWRNLFDEKFVSRIRAPSFAGTGTYTNTPVLDARRTLGIKLDGTF